MGKFKIRLEKCLSASLAVLVASPAFAAPTAFPTGGWTLKGVTNNTHSTLIADSVDPHTVWVLPPTAGTTTAGGLTGASANLGFCRNILGLRSSAQAIEQELAASYAQESGALADLKKKQDEYEAFHKAAEGIKASNSVLQQFQDMEDSLDVLNKRLQDDYAKLDSCGDAAGAACKALQDDIAEARKTRESTQAQLDATRKQAGDDLRKYTRAKGLADAAQDNAAHALDYLKTIQANLMEGHDQLMSLYGTYGKLEAGYSSILYKTGWDANVQSLSHDNPSFHFQQVQTQDARVNVSLVANPTGADDYLASFPAILGYSVNGKSYVPYGNSSPDANPQVLDSVPDQMGATLRLSLIGGCPILHPEQYDLTKDQTGTPLFAVSATYRYPLEYQTKVKFTYNLYKFYDLMKRSGTSGGFFSTSSWSDTSETKIDRDTFNAEWNESDPDNVLSQDQKRAVEKEIKAELTERVLKMMATPVFDGHAHPGDAPVAPENGAVVLANGLMSSCGWYSFYCTGGSFILRGLSAIFGSSQVEDHFRSTYDGTATETWSQNTVRLKPEVMVFAGGSEI